MINISKLIKKYKFTTDKKFGQNFLTDARILSKIVGAAGDLSGANVYEVGPGLGGLTSAILDQNPAKLLSVEVDQRCFSILDTEFAHYDNLQVLCGDALGVDPTEYLAAPIKIVANLPYNVGTTLLFKWLDDWKSFGSITLLLQKEVVDRIVAQPRTKDYGRLSVVCQYLCDVRREFNVQPGSFLPPPKVISSVVSLVPKRDLNPPFPMDRFSNVVRTLFAQRRKTISNTLGSLTSDVTNLLDRLKIPHNSRAEELTVDDFIRITEALAS